MVVVAVVVVAVGDVVDAMVGLYLHLRPSRVKIARRHDKSLDIQSPHDRLHEDVNEKETAQLNRDVHSCSRHCCAYLAKQSIA